MYQYPSLTDTLDTYFDLWNLSQKMFVIAMTLHDPNTKKHLTGLGSEADMKANYIHDRLLICFLYQ